jgi:hypothetical protein
MESTVYITKVIVQSEKFVCVICISFEEEKKQFKINLLRKVDLTFCCSARATSARTKGIWIKTFSRGWM